MLPLAIASAPVIFLLIWFYNKDRFEKEPMRMLFFAFIAGAISIIPALIFEVAWQLKGFTQTGNLVFYAYVVIGFSEEISKYLFIRRIIKRPYVNEPYDAILYSVIVSLGFAFVENIFYVLESGSAVGILRAFTAVPAHATFAAVMGYFLGRAKFYGNYFTNTLMAIGSATILHGSYDYFLFLENMPLIKTGALVSLVIGIWITRKVIRIHNENSPFRNL